jgi:hypothetical protein
MRKMMFFQFFSLLDCIGNVEQIRTPATHMNTDPYSLDSIRTGIHNPVYFMTLFTGEYCTQHQYWTSLVGLRVVAILVFAPCSTFYYRTFLSYDCRWTWPIIIGVQFLESCVADPDPHGFALTWLAWIRIRIQEHGNWPILTNNLVFCLSKRLLYGTFVGMLLDLFIFMYV